MAKKNEQPVTETAEVLLKRIREMAESPDSTASLRDLAEAFSLIAGSAPVVPPKTTRRRGAGRPSRRHAEVD